ncbi:MAG: tRNA epoxyqueuosine(34) reductase QueG [Candidatus Zixiibacteriota bacterium]|nr:MAG: tRNA epoxyqueuosine(34) reductase QueG [candidate division Zixibacteria bacterium]
MSLFFYRSELLIIPVDRGLKMLDADLIKSKAIELGADCAGITRSHSVPHRDRFRLWLKNRYAGDMEYLSRMQDERFDPSILFPGAVSIIVIGLNYFFDDHDRFETKRQFRVAGYARGEDYHRVIRRILKRLRSFLNRIEPSIKGRICVDTAPFIDKYWAQHAGLGWIGKHTNLVSRDFGSWLLLGSLIVNTEFDEYDKPHKNHCGNCTVCLESCPTKAFPEQYILDATKCISYWTIESKSSKIPGEIGRNMNRWVFGCDICLRACPFNRFEKPCRTKALEYRNETSMLETGQVLELSEDQFNLKYKSSPISRPRLSGIIRNINAAQYNNNNGRQISGMY